MNRRLVAITVSLVALASLVFAGSNGLPSLSVSQPVENEQRPTISEPARQSKRSYVDMKSDEGWQMEHNGRKIMVVVGNFAAHHNGTVITADSAVRYSERHIECFGNVLINKGSTYVYGNRAEYDGNTNEARVYSPIVKVVDGDATLYTYNFKFNTKTNIGTYSGGGVLVSGDNMLESDRGYVYTDDHNVICVERVQMRNDTYEMIADSVVYNSETEYAQFFTRTNIWDIKAGDYLYADRGAFDKAKQLYILTRNGYILTEEQELMCDTLNYYRDNGYVLLKSNIQVDDAPHKMLMFGDWGEYWKEPGNLFVTKEPSAISYDVSQGDTLFMRSDSMFLNTRYPVREKIEQARKDSIAIVEKRVADSLAKIKGAEPKASDKGANESEDKDKTSRRRQHKDNRPARAAKGADAKDSDNKKVAPGTSNAILGDDASDVKTNLPQSGVSTTDENAPVTDKPASATAAEVVSQSTETTTPKEETVKGEATSTTVSAQIADAKATTTPQESAKSDSSTKESTDTLAQSKSDSLQAQVAQTAKAVKEAVRAEQRAHIEAQKRERAEHKLAEQARLDSIKAAEKAHEDSIRMAERAYVDSVRAAEKAVVDSIKAEKRAVIDSIRAIYEEERRQAYVKITEARLADIERRHHVLDSLQREKDLADSLAVIAAQAKADSTAKPSGDSVKVKDVATKSGEQKIDNAKTIPAKPDNDNTAPNRPETAKVDTAKADSLKSDSLKNDSLKVDSVLMWSDTMTIKEQKSYYKQHLTKLRERIAKIKADTLNAKLDRIGDARQAKRTAMYKRWEYQDSVFNARAQMRADKRLVKRLARRERRGIFIKMADSNELRLADSTLFADVNLQDSLLRQRLDSLIAIYFPQEIPSPSDIMRSDSMNIDSMYREILAFSRVKIFRSDFQSVCDSLSTTNIDSIVHLYKLPVLWNGNNQITSEIMHIKTQNSQLVRADFEGKPITASQIDTAHYNQVTGKEMSALFRDNQIYRNDVNGNVQTIYYMQEDNSPEITLMAYIEAGDMTSYIENQEIVGITYRGNPVYTFYPMDKIPETQPQRLDGFKWEEMRRPTKDSVFTRIIRPSMRSEKSSLRRPLFPINALMQQRKDDYMRRGEWIERNDTLTVETVEWLESIKSE